MTDGEHPEAAESVGVSVKRVRYVAVAISGILAALGGVYLALDQHQFTDQMTAGRGFTTPIFCNTGSVMRAATS